MTPTREQYELAAKAAGIEIAWFAGAPNKLLKVGGLSYDREPWRPHEDRADAFSLLCALPRPGLDVENLEGDRA